MRVSCILNARSRQGTARRSAHENARKFDEFSFREKPNPSTTAVQNDL
jgi:hypothetical protein